MDVRIRPAAIEDAAAICTIYNQGIVDRAATLETALRTPEERREWLMARERRCPVIVAEVEGAVVGWSSLNRFNPRACYDYVADCSVYIERGWRGRGTGRVLLDRRIELAGTLEYHKLVLAALLHNAPGLSLYARAGFTKVGVHREQGRLDGRWVDAIVMEKILGP